MRTKVQTEKTCIAGHRGRVGAAICRRLEHAEGVDLLTRTHAELGLTNQATVDQLFETDRPDHIIGVGVGVKRLLLLGSSSIYPRLLPQPMAEDTLLAGQLEPINEPFSIRSNE